MKNLFGATLLLLGAMTAQAAFIVQPTAAYIAETTLIPITDPDGTLVPSLTDGTQTLTFTPGTFFAETAGTVGWSTWSSPPFAENPFPRVLANYTASMLTIDLSLPSLVFGFELEPDPFDTHTFAAEFFSGATSLGTQSIAVVGNAGARLFALDNTSGLAVDRVVISTASADIGFALANFRYGQGEIDEVPEPGTYALLGAGLIALALFRRRR